MKHVCMLLGLNTGTGLFSSLLAQTSPVATVTQPFDYTGRIVNWNVPARVTSLTIVARGAEGGRGNLDSDENGADTSLYLPGKGAVISGVISVTPGQPLKILVGQHPKSGLGGGGGSFVTDIDNRPLIIAGGRGSGKGFL